MACRGFGAEHTVIPLVAVEVHLEDPLLGPEHFDQRGKPGFQTLAQPAAARPQEQVFGHLLAEGAGAANRAAASVMGQRGLDRTEVEAPVLGKFLILTCDYRDFEDRKSTRLNSSH